MGKGESTCPEQRSVKEIQRGCLMVWTVLSLVQPRTHIWWTYSFLCYPPSGQSRVRVGLDSGEEQHFGMSDKRK